MRGKKARLVNRKDERIPLELRIGMTSTFQTLFLSQIRNLRLPSRLKRIAGITFFFVFFIIPFIVSAKKTTLAIFAIYDVYHETNEYSEKLLDLLFVKFSSLKSVSLVERKDIDKLFSEKELIAENVTPTNKNFFSFGKILGADYIITGKIYSLQFCDTSEHEKNSPEKLFFNFKVINCRTGQIHGFSTVWKENKNNEDGGIIFFSDEALKYMKTVLPYLDKREKTQPSSNITKKKKWEK